MCRNWNATMLWEPCHSTLSCVLSAANCKSVHSSEAPMVPRRVAFRYAICMPTLSHTVCDARGHWDAGALAQAALWFLKTLRIYMACMCNTLQHTATHCNTLQNTSTNTAETYACQTSPSALPVPILHVSGRGRGGGGVECVWVFREGSGVAWMCVCVCVCSCGGGVGRR